MFCKICCDAGKPKAQYTNHRIYEGYGSERRVVCPTLLKNKCHNCGKNGHTTKYCKEEKRDENREYRRRTERAEPYMQRIPLPAHAHVRERVHARDSISSKRKSAPVSLDSNKDFPCLGREEKSKSPVSVSVSTINPYDAISMVDTCLETPTPSPSPNTPSYLGVIKRSRYRDESKEDIETGNEAEMKALRAKVSKQEKIIMELEDKIKKMEAEKSSQSMPSTSPPPSSSPSSKTWSKRPKLEVKRTTKVKETTSIPLIKKPSNPWKSWHDASMEYDPLDEEMFEESEHEEDIGVLC